MKPYGTKGTYRELYVDYRPFKIVCSNCSYLKEIEPEDNYEYELWFKTQFKNHTIWANNEEHIDSLIEWLKQGKRIPGEYFESLPKWMVTNRLQVIHKLKTMKEKMHYNGFHATAYRAAARPAAHEAER